MHIHLKIQNKLYPIRRIISVGLLSLFVCLQTAPLLLNYFIQVHKQLVRQEIKNRTQLVSFSLTKQEWENSVKHGSSEIELNGKMFDLKEVAFTSEKVIITGHFDHEEDQMIKVAKGVEKKDQRSENSVAFQTILFCNELISFDFFKATEEIELYAYVPPHATCTFSQQDSPPPKV